MKKRIVLSTILFGVTMTASLVVALVSTRAKKSTFGRANVDDYTLTLDDSNAPGALDSVYQDSTEGYVETALGNELELQFVNAKELANGFAELAPHGRIFNFASSNTAITGINGVSFSGSGSFVFKPGLSKGFLMDVAPLNVEANGGKVAIPVCDYFEIEAGDNGASIESLEFTYSCDAAAYSIKMLNGTYTGIGTDSNTWKVVIEDGAVEVSSLDKASNMNLTGTASMTSRTAVSITFNEIDLAVVYAYDGHSLSYVSKTGAQAAYYPDVSGNRVYNVEDFESYSATGQGYTNATTKYQTTGLRSHFYADYYTGSGSGDIGGSGWPIMTSSDNTNFNSSKGHNNSKVGIFKLSNNTGMRYISMNERYGVNSIIGKGTKLSFWARGAFTNQNYNTNSSSNTPMKFYAFYTTPLTASTQGNRQELEYTVQAGSEWQHFEVSLVEGRNYYGFGFYGKQSSGATQYIPIDDVQIYTASPYAEYVAPISVTGVTVSPETLTLKSGATAQLTATIAPAEATNKNYSWSSSNESFATVTQDGVVTAVAPGSADITCTTADGGFTDKCVVTVTALDYPEGTFASAVSLMGNSYDLVIAIGNATNNEVAVRISTSDVVPTGITYNSSTKAFSIPTTGKLADTYTVGTITGTYDAENDRLINVNADGQISAAVSNVTLTRPTSGIYLPCEGSTSDLQGQFGRRYRSKGASSWSNDTGNADRIQSETSTLLSGNTSMSVRPCGNTFDAYGFVLKNDLGAAKTVKSIHFWVYNPCDYDITFRAYYYKGTGFSNNGQIGLTNAADKAKAHSWTYVSRGFTQSAIYNFTLSVWTADQTEAGTSMSARLVFDDIYLY